MERARKVGRMKGKTKMEDRGHEEGLGRERYLRGGQIKGGTRSLFRRSFRAAASRCLLLLQTAVWG